MVEAKFSNAMKDVLKTIIGKTFCSYECEDLVPNQAYGNLQINLNDSSIELFNELKELPFYDSTEDISFFSCIKKPLNGSFRSYCAEPSKKHLINEKVLSVYIVDDCISVNDGEYNIRFDMAIILKTDKHSYVFSRGWFFSEIIDISIDKDFDDIYPVSKVIEDWSDEGENKVNVERSIIEI